MRLETFFFTFDSIITELRVAIILRLSHDFYLISVISYIEPSGWNQTMSCWSEILNRCVLISDVQIFTLWKGTKNIKANEMAVQVNADFQKKFISAHKNLTMWITMRGSALTSCEVIERFRPHLITWTQLTESEMRWTVKHTLAIYSWCRSAVEIQSSSNSFYQFKPTWATPYCSTV